MAKTPNTLYDLDFTKYTTNFDPSIMAQEFTRAFSQFQVPGVDVNAIIASQQKNLDALTAANQTAIEGIRAVVTRQSEIMQQTMLATASAIEAMTKSGSPQDASVKQAELVRSTFEKALADMTEIADMVARSNLSASAAINKRLSESLDEVKKLAEGIK